MVLTGFSNSTTSTSATMSPPFFRTKIGHIIGTSGNVFEVYQLLTVRTSDITIYVPIPLPMAQPPYRKVMVTDLFFDLIKSLVVDSFFSADFVSKIDVYFDFNISSVKEEATVAVNMGFVTAKVSCSLSINTTFVPLISFTLHYFLYSGPPILTTGTWTHNFN